MISLMVILFSTKCFLFVYMYIDLLKLKAYELFENSDADLSWLLFQRSQLVLKLFNKNYYRYFQQRKEDYYTPTMKLTLQVFLNKKFTCLRMDLKTLLPVRHMEESDVRQITVK